MARNKVYASPEHKRLRKAYALEVAAGRVHCWRCGHPIPPGSKWELGHDDNDRTMYRGPEHRHCNRRAAARKGARIANAMRQTTRLTW